MTPSDVAVCAVRGEGLARGVHRHAGARAADPAAVGADAAGRVRESPGQPLGAALPTTWDAEPISGTENLSGPGLTALHDAVQHKGCELRHRECHVARLARTGPMSATPSDPIEIALDDPSAMIETQAVSPFRDGDLLRPEAAAYLLRRVRMLPRHAPVRVTITLPAEVIAAPQAGRIAPAIAAHFAALARTEDKAMADHMADAWRAAALGLVVFGVCLAVAWRLYAHLEAYGFARIVRESFVILGWVAMWKPIEMLVHERLPIARRRRLYLRIATADIALEPRR